MSQVKYRFTLLSLSLCLISATLLGAISPQYQEWGKGPVQWIMSGQEKRAWHDLKTDADASHFIDMFWARRDPTPGTPRNEFLESFNQRVVYADRTFPDPGTRGAMTDRGRVFIVLGPPPNMADASIGSTQQSTGDLEQDPSGGGSGHNLGARFDWVWSHTDAAKYGLPQLEVVFAKDPEGQRIRRDPSRPDFSGAEPIAIKLAIVNPNLTDIPQWALQGGLNQHAAIPVPIAELPGTNSGGSTTTHTIIAAPVTPLSLPAGVAPGASQLTLLRDISTISTETAVDPFDKIVAVDQFHPEDVLGWAARYCDASGGDVTLRFKIHLTGQNGAKKIDRSSPPDEMMPDRLRSVQGCYLLRGEIPLPGIAATKGSTYQFQLTVENPATGKSDVLTKGFRVE